METRNTGRKRGFTLIELLVVIAIIAILAAILFPVFARARENARRSTCQSNLKQIALGMFQYTQDYDEKFPVYWHQQGWDPARVYGWADSIQPYMKSPQIYQCPSEPEGPPYNWITSYPGYIDYAINMHLIYGGIFDYVGGYAGSKSLAVLTQPSLTVMMLDFRSGTQTNTYSIGCYPNFDDCAPGLAKYPTGLAERHLEGMNYSFTDGHVKWYKSLDAGTSASVYNFAATNTGSSPTFNLVP